MKIIALMTVYNEEIYLSRILDHLYEEGIQTCIIDNESTDRTPEIIRSFMDKGVIYSEVLPRRGVFELDTILRHEEKLAAGLGADWYIHHDADEIRQAPNPYRTLYEGIVDANRQGYNAINFDEFVFVPTGPEENYEHDRFVEEMNYYYFFEPRPKRQVRAWKYSGQKVDLHSSGGHEVQFQGRRISPHAFINRHYMVLSLPHAIRKYCGRVFSEIERKEKGWHKTRAGLKPEQIRFPDKDQLCHVSDNNEWDRSRPWAIHPIFEKVQPLPSGSIGPKAKAILPSPPVPFIVGFGRSGTTLLRLMLDSHPVLAIPPETHFIPSVVAECMGSSDPRGDFLKILTGYRTWGDFHLDPEVFRSKILKLDAFDLTNGLRSFYQLYAERFGKTRWGDKTPLYIHSMEMIQQLFPEARFVHLIRDGRDTALSYRKMWFGPKSIQEVASQWIWGIAQARRQAQNIKYYIEIRYEDLILDTIKTLKRICEFIELDWDSRMLDYYLYAQERLNELDRDVMAPSGNRKVSGNERIAIHSLTSRPPEAKRIGQWKVEMTVLERKGFEAIARPLLAELGYEID